MNSFKALVDRAADRANLNVANPVATNALGLIVHTMVECGQLKLPKGALQTVAEVLKDRTGHTYSGGSLRWYRVMLSKDPEFVARFMTLPEGYQMLVRDGQANGAS